MKKRDFYELMAPAGSFESLVSAIQGGADSVYFGIGQLNMRARSSFNFTIRDLPEIVRIAADNRVKTYLTLNTIVYDHELEEMREIVDEALRNQVTAIIASDQSVLQYARDAGASIHLSTQLNISNVESLRFYADYADVVVLARELNLEQVKKISEAIQMDSLKGPSGELIRIEMFVHGALCMAVSGKCYLSLHEYNHSANRGDCIQVCRRSYVVTDKETGHEMEVDNEFIMSPKDLKTIHFLNRIMDAGVRVLKIEGRARSPEYVKTVTACYDEAIKAIVSDQYTDEKIEDWDRRLATVFNRGFWDGYYLGQRLGEWSKAYGSQATKRKLYLGRITNFYGKIGVAESFIQTGELSKGDEILITGPTTGVLEARVETLRVNEKETGVAVKGEVCSFALPGPVRRSDKLYKVVPASRVKTQ
ncbi:MAG: U32 family peptidase [Bacteroidales bacterium]|nr:U32 family peptidase [Bacteroidales bacterium]MBN2697818.1 U32 family peptidase [Bacteroidales bacterium]